VESGFYNPTGNASIDEKDLGYAFFSGLKLIDKFKNIPVNLNLEFAFNEFGLSKSTCGNGDTLTTDGRFNGGSYSADYVITCAYNNNHTDIDSYSTSVGLNAEYLLPLLPKKNLLISGTYGIHRWDQSETDYIPETNISTYDYSGVDDFYSIGLEIDYNNLTFGIEHSKHYMYYDATSKSLYAKYNF
jgi:hypothetical protein